MQEPRSFQNDLSNMKNIRTSAFAALFLLAATAALGQEYTLIQSDEVGNKRGYMVGDNIVEKGDLDDQFYTVELRLPIAYSGIPKPKGLLVREVNRDYKEKRSLELDDTKGANILYVKRDGRRLHIVFDLSAKRRFTVRHATVDLDNFALVVDSALVDIEVSKKAEHYLWESPSADKAFYGLVYAVVDEKAGFFEQRALLFGPDMRRRWAKDIAAGSISTILTSDRGTIALAGIQQNEKGSVGTVVEFNAVDSAGAKQGFVRSDKSLADLTLLSYRDGMLLATALETERGIGWAGNFRAGSVITTGTTYTGCAAFCYSFDRQRLLGSDSYTFTRDDARRFYGASVVADLTNPSINFITVKDYAATPQGGAVLYQRLWSEKITRTGPGTSPAIEETSYFKGMLLVHVGPQGSIDWTRGIPHDNIGNGYPLQHRETDLVVQDSTLYILTNESKHEKETYDPTSAANKAILGSLSALSVYSFAPDGTVGKKMLVRDKATFLLTPLQRQSDGSYVFLSRGHRPMGSSITELRIR